MSVISARFLEVSKDWVCDGYYVDIRYVSIASESPSVLCATIILSPLPHTEHDPCSLKLGRFSASRIQIGPVAREDLILCLEQVTKGRLEIEDITEDLVKKTDIEHSSDGEQRDRWFQPLHLKVSSRTCYSFRPTELVRLDDALRCCETPFDGIDDFCIWMGLPNLAKNDFRPQLEVHISPPVDLTWSGEELREGNLSLTLVAHNDFDISKMSLGLRMSPGPIAGTRSQVADKIIWKNEKNEFKTGRLSVASEAAHSTLAMICIQGTTVRRQWFSDPSRSTNPLYVSTQYFDKDFRQLKKTILDGNDSDKFEKAVASLAFILGFSSALQVESAGRLVLLECTIRVADVTVKAGKLADRKNGLQSFLRSQNDLRDVIAILVCRQSSSNPALHIPELKSMGIHLLSRESLEDALIRISSPSRAEELLDEIVASPWPQAEQAST
jgi:hypothetical protein